MHVISSSFEPVLVADLFSVLTTECASRKGRTKKEASCNTNRPNPAGHERKIVEKLQNAEKKSKE
ncbi:nuclear protein 1-like [Sinocyclocheilus grahami]|uniref:nuclear protein 1-like n=1 Tax=Sinocyclocheilus grahami TaxID=75366 RepID=UPI0007AC8007|nr:PREDICTED: nuclear protein 1-like [Sinocyclocheilus grahami]